MTLFDEPAARRTDPLSAWEAARLASAGSSELTRAIRAAVEMYGPMTVFQIAGMLSGPRWQSDTVRTAVSRALVKTGEYRKHHGRRYAIYTTP